MFAFVISAVNAGSSEGLRVFLLILWLLAVLLVLSGGVIAVLTLYRHRKLLAESAREAPGE